MKDVSMILFEEILEESNGSGNIVERILAFNSTSDHDFLMDWIDWAESSHLLYRLEVYAKAPDEYVAVSDEFALEYLLNN